MPVLLTLVLISLVLLLLLLLPHLTFAVSVDFEVHSNGSARTQPAGRQPYDCMPLLLLLLLLLPHFRLVVNDDFEVQFNGSARTQPGLGLKPYRFNATAKPSYAHAALITGYDNKEYTW
jgi:hypothetical protein